MVGGGGGVGHKWPPKFLENQGLESHRMRKAFWFQLQLIWGGVGGGWMHPHDFLSCTRLEIALIFSGCYLNVFKASWTFQVSETFESRGMTSFSRPCQGPIKATSSFRSQNTTFSEPVTSCGVSGHKSVVQYRLAAPLWYLNTQCYHNNQTTTNVMWRHTSPSPAPLSSKNHEREPERQEWSQSSSIMPREKNVRKKTSKCKRLAF